MKIKLDRINEAVHIKAVNENGAEVHMDGSPEIGGKNLGFRPMQMLLAGLGGCASMDILSILNKMQQKVTAYHVEVDGEREAGKEPSLFRDIHVHFELTGEGLDPEKVKKAVDLSMTKYCSVAKTLEYSAKITYDFAVQPVS